MLLLLVNDTSRRRRSRRRAEQLQRLPRCRGGGVVDLKIKNVEPTQEAEAKRAPTQRSCNQDCAYQPLQLQHATLLHST